MSIFLGSDIAASGIARFLRLLEGAFLTTLIFSFLALGIAGYFLVGDLKQNEWHAVKSYWARKNGTKWRTGWLTDPQLLLSPAQKKRGLKVTANSKMLDRFVIRFYAKQKPKFHKLGWVVAGSGISGGVLFVLISIKLGAGDRRKTKRGARIIEPSLLAAQVRKKVAKPEFKLANIKVPGLLFHKHLMCLGSPGAGKSQLLSDLMDQIRARGERALIFDPGGEFYSTFAKSNDVLLNPFDCRSAPWGLQKEITNLWDCESISSSLIQNSNTGGNDFFYEGSRIVMAESLKRFGQKMTMPQLFEALTTASAKELHKALAGTPATPFIDPSAKSQAAGIQATLNSKLSAWQYLESSQNPFSIREWVRKGSGWLFLTSREDAHSALQPLLSLWIEMAVTELLCRKSNQGERIWLIIDELASLQKLPALLRILSMGRKYRVAVVLATQTPSQLASIYGREGMPSLLGTVGNRVVYRLEEFEDADAASKFFGTAEIAAKKESVNMGERQQGTNLNESLEQEQIIMPSQIQNLPDLECYLKLAGGFSPTKTKQKYKDRVQVSQPFQARRFEAKAAPAQPKPKPKPKPQRDEDFF